MLGIIFTIIGTFIGAGFSSGKEVYLFFYKYGIYGLFGIIISSFFISLIVKKTLIIIAKNNIKNYNNFLDLIIKNYLIKNVIKKTINFFLLISFCVMISGFCEFLYQEFQVNKAITYIVILFFCFYIFKKNINVIERINKIFIPFFIIFVLIFFIKNINYNYYFIENNLLKKVNNFDLNFIFFIKALLYSNYNLLVVIPIISCFYKSLKNNNIKYITLFVGIIIFVLSFIIFCMLSQSNFLNIENISNYEMPIMCIVGKYGKLYRYVYSFIIAGSISTTAISSGFSFLKENTKNRVDYEKNILYLILGSIVSIRVGFSRAIEIAYPVFGIVGIIQSFYILKLHK